jgi:hypothetical protein
MLNKQISKENPYFIGKMLEKWQIFLDKANKRGYIYI